MSFDTFTAALNVDSFPFVTDLLPRPVLLTGLDVPPRVPRTDLGTFESKNPELAQHIYAQNVMPSSEGLMSVGYQQIIPAIVGQTHFDEAIVLRDVDENVFLFSPGHGNNFIYRADVGTWVSNNPIASLDENILVTRAFVNGRTFVCYGNTGVFEYDTATNSFNEVTVVGMNKADIDGISASNNYLLAWNNIEIRWSSLVDPLDLTPSIFTGAGFATPQDVRGPIRNIVPISGGFIAYTTRNAVAALYTNNARAPFAFKEISNTGGIIHPEEISLEATLGFHYAFSSAGLQKITASNSEVVSVAATDFIAGRMIETFDTVTNTLTVEKLSTDLALKIAYVSNRYLVISYGKATSPHKEFTHAIVLDTQLKRWGKLKVDHTDCFTYPYPSLIGQLSEVRAKQSMAFLQKDGTVLLCILDYREMQDQGVLMLGRFQRTRGQAITLQTIEFENLTTAYPPSVYLLLSDDGKNYVSVQPLQLLSNGNTYKKYGAPSYSGSGAAPRRTAKSFSALITGTFELSTAMFTVTRHGNR